MKLSIIIPVYNASTFLEKCIQSLITQSTTDVEYLFIDDGSTDNSKKIINKYSKENKSIKYFYKKNGGVSSARNMGIEKSTGKYIMFVDSDDFLDENWYIVIKKYLEMNLNLIIFSKNAPKKKIEKKEILDACIMKNNEFSNCCIMSPCSKLYLRKTLCENKIFFDKNIINGEDMLFNYTVLCASTNIKLVSEGIYYYRKNVSSATNTFNEKIFESDRIFLENIRKIMEKNKIKTVCDDMSFLTLNGIIVITKRISFSADKYKTKLLKKNIEKNDYEREMINYNKIKKFLGKYDRWILSLIIKKKYGLCMFILVLIRKFKLLIFKRNKEIKCSKI